MEYSRNKQKAPDKGKQGSVRPSLVPHALELSTGEVETAGLVSSRLALGYTVEFKANHTKSFCMKTKQIHTKTVLYETFHSYVDVCTKT